MDEQLVHQVPMREPMARPFTIHFKHESSMRTLEFDKIKLQIREHAATALGKERLDELAPLPNVTAARKELDAVDEALTFIYRFGGLPFGGVTDIRAPLKKSEIGGVLAAEELVRIVRFIEGGRNVRQAVEQHQAELDCVLLSETAAELFDAKQTQQEIQRAVADDATIYDHASDNLRKIRSQRRQAEARVRQVLDQMLRSMQKYLQDPVIALRGNSLCLPVRVEFKNQIHGVVHDYSASGATVFIEPQAVVELNRQVHELALEEEREIERILIRLSAVVGQVVPELLHNAQVLAKLDTWFAKAAYAKAQSCTKPSLREDGVWHLREARHPLIARESAVPMDITLGDSYSMIIITGPNTGGKTVALKTVGLLTLLAMSGTFVPAREQTALAWCDEVYADIGDEQSIEQSLSTFSSHMRNIVGILGRVSRHSLVLLDELGAGTDPTEGAALAIAILESLKDVGANVVATTHYPELKGYAFSESQAVNASVEFDVETLKPTYRLLVGVPGRSNAIAIASRLGLSENVIEKAKSLMHTSDLRVEDLIRDLETARREAEEARTVARAERSEAGQLRAQWEEKWKSFSDESERIREQARAQARDIVKRAENEANRVIEELRRMQKSGGGKDHEFVNLRKALEQAVPEGQSSKSRRTGPAGKVPIGAIVRVQSLGQKGEVLEQSADLKTLTVQLGLLRMKVERSDIEVLQEKPKVEQPVNFRRGMPKDMRLELDVRGEIVEDALPRIDKYLDDAVMNRIQRVSIIHGKGTGSLRNGVRKHLSSHPLVHTWTQGGPGEGGDGATIVEVNL